MYRLRGPAAVRSSGSLEKQSSPTPRRWSLGRRPLPGWRFHPNRPASGAPDRQTIGGGAPDRPGSQSSPPAAARGPRAPQTAFGSTEVANRGSDQAFGASFISQNLLRFSSSTVLSPSFSRIGIPCQHALQLRDGNFQFRRNPVRVPPLIFVAQRAIVPERAFLFTREPLPDGFAVSPIVRQNRSDVMQLVGSRHQPCLGIGILHLAQIAFLPLHPLRLRLNERIRTALHNLRYPRTKPLPDFPQPRHAAAVFHHIMQQRCNRHVLITARFEHQ